MTRRMLSLREAAKLPLKHIRLAASTSFTETQVAALDTLFSRLRRSGGDLRTIMRSTEMQDISKKIEKMKTTLERQHQRRFVKLAKGENHG